MIVQRLYIFHYHLAVGGVTEVIERGINSLLLNHQSLAITLVSGGSGAEVAVQRLQQCWPSLTMVHDAKIGYQQAQSSQSVENLADHLRANYSKTGALWWVHNYHLGKNIEFTSALIKLACAGQQAMILQVHDFPECGRVENLHRLEQGLSLVRLYPVSPHLHYVVINHRDRNLLLQAGMPPSSVSVLVNPLNLNLLPEVDEDAIRKKLQQQFAHKFTVYDAEKPLALYPVRAIRRKNILEAAAITLMLDSPWNLIVTLPGVSKQERPYSQLVSSLFEQGLIPGLMGISLKLSDALTFPMLCAASQFFLSSAIVEGFGYGFFNAAYWQKPLLARYLDILDGFQDFFEGSSVQFYRQFMVSISPVQLQQVKEQLQSNMERLKVLKPSSLQQLRQLDAAAIDFSLLPIKLQVELLQRLHCDSGYRAALSQLNPVCSNFINRAGLHCPQRNSLSSATNTNDFYQSYNKIIAKIGKAQAVKINQISSHLSNYFNSPNFYSSLLSDKYLEDGVGG